MSTKFDGGVPCIFKPFSFTQYQNSLIFKLDDFQNAEGLPTAGFTGINVNGLSNTNL